MIKKDFVIQLGYPPIRIDILTGISGLDFKTAFAKKKIQNISGVGKVNFISYKDLIIIKRLKDKQALEWLKKYGKGSS